MGNCTAKFNGVEMNHEQMSKHVDNLPSFNGMAYIIDLDWNIVYGKELEILQAFESIEKLRKNINEKIIKHDDELFTRESKTQIKELDDMQKQCYETITKLREEICSTKKPQWKSWLIDGGEKPIWVKEVIDFSKWKLD